MKQSLTRQAMGEKARSIVMKIRQMQKKSKGEAVSKAKQVMEMMRPESHTQASVGLTGLCDEVQAGHKEGACGFLVVFGFAHATAPVCQMRKTESFGYTYRHLHWCAACDEKLSHITRYGCFLFTASIPITTPQAIWTADDLKHMSQWFARLLWASMIESTKVFVFL